MKVAKPDWIHHNGMPICSIDIHPDGSRLATGGQGVDSGRVVVWNMAPVVSEEKEMDENVPRMLCQLDNHLACVNCVRWSYSGKYLASGGDDKLVMVWSISKSSGGNSVFGGKGKVNIEAWRCVFTLRSHEGDVLDIAWSPSDRWIATCSIDNTVIVWSADNLPEIVTVLRGHTGLVKGVSWDPVGKYLSSQSDDRSVRIWRTADWKQESVITTPFEKCSGTTLVLRLSWSPDGQYLVTAHAMNGAIPTAQIIERDGWAHDKDFVGHHMAITCVRFSNRIMEFGRGRACALALGSRDRSVSVWSTSLVRPLVVLEELFSSPVGDLAWDPTGQALMAVSTDGTAALMHFTQEEIGSPITDVDKSALFEKLYGKVGAESGASVVVENPEILASRSPLTVATPAPTLKQDSYHAPPAARHQIETKTKDGRRRITPIYIPPAHDSNEEVVPFGSDSTFSSSCVGAKSRIVVERREEASGAASRAASPPLPPPEPRPERPRARRGEDGGFSLLLGWTEKGESKRRRGTPLAVPYRQKKDGGPHYLLPPLALAASNTTVKLPGGGGFVEIENRAARSPQGRISSVRSFASQGDQSPAWEIMIGCDVVGCVGGGGIVALAGSDGTVRVVDPSDGAPLLPPLALSAPASLLRLSSKYLLLLSADGRLSSWSIGPPLSPAIPDLSIVPALHSPEGGNVRIKECLISDAGEPMLALSSGRAYAYSIRHNSWLLVGDSSDPVCKHVLQSFKSPPPGPPLPLKTIQTAASNGTGKAEVSQVSRPCTLSYLEAQVSCAKALNSPHEYKFWLLSLVRFLLQQGMERRVRGICEGLLGPTHSTRTTSTWQPDVLGLEKQALLREVLSEISIHLPSQRLYMEFSDQLNNH